MKIPHSRPLAGALAVIFSWSQAIPMAFAQGYLRSQAMAEVGWLGQDARSRLGGISSIEQLGAANAVQSVRRLVDSAVAEARAFTLGHPLEPQLDTYAASYQRRYGQPLPEEGRVRLRQRLESAAAAVDGLAVGDLSIVVITDELIPSLLVADGVSHTPIHAALALYGSQAGNGARIYVSLEKIAAMLAQGEVGLEAVRRDIAHRAREAANAWKHVDEPKEIEQSVAKSVELAAAQVRHELAGRLAALWPLRQAVIAQREEQLRKTPRQVTQRIPLDRIKKLFGGDIDANQIVEALQRQLGRHVPAILDSATADIEEGKVVIRAAYHGAEPEDPAIHRLLVDGASAAVQELAALHKAYPPEPGTVESRLSEELIQAIANFITAVWSNKLSQSPVNFDGPYRTSGGPRTWIILTAHRDEPGVRDQLEMLQRQVLKEPRMDTAEFFTYGSLKLLRLFVTDQELQAVRIALAESASGPKTSSGEPGAVKPPGLGPRRLEATTERILDSRGDQTLKVTLQAGGKTGVGFVPSGASKGEREALELRDGDFAEAVKRGEATFALIDQARVVHISAADAIRVITDGRASTPEEAIIWLKSYSAKGTRVAQFRAQFLLKQLQEAVSRAEVDLRSEGEVDAWLERMEVRFGGDWERKNYFGANAILAISAAAFRLAAALEGVEPYAFNPGPEPVGSVIYQANILNGGVHADNTVDIQETMLTVLADPYDGGPDAIKTDADAIHVGAQLFGRLKAKLKQRGLNTNAGDEGGLAPDVAQNAEYLRLAAETIQESPWKDHYRWQIGLSLDAAFSERSFREGEQILYWLEGESDADGKPQRITLLNGRQIGTIRPVPSARPWQEFLVLTHDELTAYWQDLIRRYPIISIEDGYDQNDMAGYQQLTAYANEATKTGWLDEKNRIIAAPIQHRLGIDAVGDDLLVTSLRQLIAAVEGQEIEFGGKRLAFPPHTINAILVKISQVGSITEAKAVIRWALAHGITVKISHRSGETEDTLIADLAKWATTLERAPHPVSGRLPRVWIKTGSFARSERTAKYNRLIEIDRLEAERGAVEMENRSGLRAEGSEQVPPAQSPQPPAAVTAERGAVNERRVRSLRKLQQAAQQLTAVRSNRFPAPRLHIEFSDALDRVEEMRRQGWLIYAGNRVAIRYFEDRDPVTGKSRLRWVAVLAQLNVTRPALLTAIRRYGQGHPDADVRTLVRVFLRRNVERGAVARSAQTVSEEVFALWRRSYDVRPPGGESLEDTEKRAWPYFEAEALRRVKLGQHVLASLHGNTFRGIAMHLFGLTPEEVQDFTFPLATPVHLQFNPDGSIRRVYVLAGRNADPKNVAALVNALGTRFEVMIITDVTEDTRREIVQGVAGVGSLTLLRHGQTIASDTLPHGGFFAGWIDVELTDAGENDARAAGELMHTIGIPVDVALTSDLSRAGKTLTNALEGVGRSVSVITDARLRERNYGKLSGTFRKPFLSDELPRRIEWLWQHQPDLQAADARKIAEALAAHWDEFSPETGAVRTIPTIDILAQRITPIAGAQTGQVYVGDAVKAGATGMIAGHSETRPGSETPIVDSDEEINAQIRSGIAQGLRTIILAVGETKEATTDSQLRARNSLLSRQMRAALQGITAEQAASRLFVAYEPRWAITGSGAGRPATGEYVQSAHRLIRRVLQELFGEEFAKQTYIIYGGSANPDNAAGYLEQEDVDGLLPGGASTSTGKFIPIVQVAQRLAAEKKARIGRGFYVAGNQKTYPVTEEPAVFTRALVALHLDPALVQIGIAPTFPMMKRWAQSAVLTTAETGAVTEPVGRLTPTFLQIFRRLAVRDPRGLLLQFSPPTKAASGQTRVTAPNDDGARRLMTELAQESGARIPTDATAVNTPHPTLSLGLEWPEYLALYDVAEEALAEATANWEALVNALTVLAHQTRLKQTEDSEASVTSTPTATGGQIRLVSAADGSLNAAVLDLVETAEKVQIPVVDDLSVGAGRLAFLLLPNAEQFKALDKAARERGAVLALEIPESIFGRGFGYDIRGQASDNPELGKNNQVTLTPAVAEAIGKALGSTVPIGARAGVTGDHRESTPALRQALVDGMRAVGINVETTDEFVPTGATSLKALADEYALFVQVTGSHNPWEGNGFKITQKQNEQQEPDLNGIPSALFGQKLVDLYNVAQTRAWRHGAPQGTLKEMHGVVDEYNNRLDAILPQLKKRWRVVVDSGNGVGAKAMVFLLRRRGVEVVELFSEPHPRFPNHPADPSKDDITAPHNKSGMRYLSEKVRELNAHLKPGETPFVGIALDGDGDRSAFVDEKGQPIPPERLLVAFYHRFLLENQSAIAKLRALGHTIQLALDVRASGIVTQIISSYPGVRGVFIPAGYPIHRTFVRQEIAEIRKVAAAHGLADDPDIKRLLESYTSAEASGHYFFSTDSAHPDIKIDDGIYSAVWGLHILDTAAGLEAKSAAVPLPVKNVYQLDEFFAAIPKLPVTTDIRDPVTEQVKFDIVERAKADAIAKFGDQLKPTQGLTRRDGLKIQSPDDGIVEVDGVRLQLKDGSWLLIRASNTSSMLTYKVEAPTQARLVELTGQVLEILRHYEAQGLSTAGFQTELERQRAKAAAATVNRLLVDQQQFVERVKELATAVRTEQGSQGVGKVEVNEATKTIKFTVPPSAGGNLRQALQGLVISAKQQGIDALANAPLADNYTASYFGPTWPSDELFQQAHRAATERGAVAAPVGRLSADAVDGIIRYTEAVRQQRAQRTDQAVDAFTFFIPRGGEVLLYVTRREPALFAQLAGLQLLLMERLKPHEDLRVEMFRDRDGQGLRLSLRLSWLTAEEFRELQQRVYPAPTIPEIVDLFVGEAYDDPPHAVARIRNRQTLEDNLQAFVEGRLSLTTLVAIFWDHDRDYFSYGKSHNIGGPNMAIDHAVERLIRMRIKYNKLGERGATRHLDADRVKVLEGLLWAADSATQARDGQPMTVGERLNYVLERLEEGLAVKDVLLTAAARSTLSDIALDVALSAVMAEAQMPLTEDERRLIQAVASEPGAVNQLLVDQQQFVERVKELATAVRTEQGSQGVGKVEVNEATKTIKFTVPPSAGGNLRQALQGLVISAKQQGIDALANAPLADNYTASYFGPTWPSDELFQQAHRAATERGSVSELLLELPHPLTLDLVFHPHLKPPIDVRREDRRDDVQRWVVRSREDSGTLRIAPHTIERRLGLRYGRSSLLRYRSSRVDSPVLIMEPEGLEPSPRYRRHALTDAIARWQRTDGLPQDRLAIILQMTDQDVQRFNANDRLRYVIVQHYGIGGGWMRLELEPRHPRPPRERQPGVKASSVERGAVEREKRSGLRAQGSGQLPAAQSPQPPAAVTAERGAATQVGRLTPAAIDALADVLVNLLRAGVAYYFQAGNSGIVVRLNPPGPASERNMRAPLDRVVEQLQALDPTIKVPVVSGTTAYGYALTYTFSLESLEVMAVYHAVLERGTARGSRTLRRQLAREFNAPPGIRGPFEELFKDAGQERGGWVHRPWEVRASNLPERIEEGVKTLRAQGVTRLGFIAMGGESSIIGPTRDTLINISSTAPHKFKRILSRLDVAAMKWFVVSKSGTTAESQRNADYLEQYYRAQGLDPAKFIVYVSDPGTPFELKTAQGFAVERRELDGATSIGGRNTLVNTPTLTAYAWRHAGHLRQMLEALTRAHTFNDGADDPWIKAAVDALRFIRLGRPKVAVIQPAWMRRAQEIWTQQNPEESLGKDNKGFTVFTTPPALARLRELRDRSWVFIEFRVKGYEQETSRYAKQATDGGFHVLTIPIDVDPAQAKLVAPQIAAYGWMKFVAIIGGLWGINFSDQPPVEAYKALMRSKQLTLADAIQAAGSAVATSADGRLRFVYDGLLSPLADEERAALQRALRGAGGNPAKLYAELVDALSTDLDTQTLYYYDDVDAVTGRTLNYITQRLLHRQMGYAARWVEATGALHGHFVNAYSGQPHQMTVHVIATDHEQPQPPYPDGAKTLIEGAVAAHLALVQAGRPSVMLVVNGRLDREGRKTLKQFFADVATERGATDGNIKAARAATSLAEWLDALDTVAGVLRALKAQQPGVGCDVMAQAGGLGKALHLTLPDGHQLVQTLAALQMDLQRATWNTSLRMNAIHAWDTQLVTYVVTTSDGATFKALRAMAGERGAAGQDNRSRLEALGSRPEPSLPTASNLQPTAIPSAQLRTTDSGRRTTSGKSLAFAEQPYLSRVEALGVTTDDPQRLKQALFYRDGQATDGPVALHGLPLTATSWIVVSSELFTATPDSAIELGRVRQQIDGLKRQSGGDIPVRVALVEKGAANVVEAERLAARLFERVAPASQGLARLSREEFDAVLPGDVDPNQLIGWLEALGANSRIGSVVGPKAWADAIKARAADPRQVRTVVFEPGVQGSVALQLAVWAAATAGGKPDPTLVAKLEPFSNDEFVAKKTEDRELLTEMASYAQALQAK